MKFSIYNITFTESNGVILYNIASDGILQLNKQVAELLDKYANNVDALHDVFPDLFDALEKYGFIVADGMDEVQVLIDGWRKEFISKETFRLTVNPTLNCNLRCWYCYENHDIHRVMSDETINRIKRLINNKVHDKKLKTFHLDFFGGEPLLQFDRVVYPLIEETYSKCREYEKEFHLAFTTNGTLLTHDKIKRIASLLETANNGHKTIPSFQITLDGNEDYHNKVRKTPTGDGSYQTIMSNIKEALSRGFDVFVRFNTTNENIDSYLDVIDDFAEIPTEQTAHLQFDLQKVWQDNASQQTRDKVKMLSDALSAEGFHVAIQSICNRRFCYADKDNNVVANYDGNIYKCTAREFNPELAEGVIDADGNIIYNSRYMKRQSVRFGNEMCRRCKIYPICHGGCTQDKLENDGKEICLRHHSEEEKMVIIKERLRYIISNRKK